MEEHSTSAAAPSSSVRARLILPVAGAGLLIGCGLLLLRGGHETHTVSQVARSIHEIALTANAPDAPPEAGLVGPWRVSAERLDPLSGKLIDFNIKSGVMMISARTAQVVIDPDADTFSFDMRDVVFVRVPRLREEGREAAIHHLDRYTLGPAPYNVDIVPDGAAAFADASD